MRFLADLHVHSRFARATSRDAELEPMAVWAARKGVALVGTGDFTHPAWLAELAAKLVPAEPGFYRLRPSLEAKLARECPRFRGQLTRFVLQVEISTVYRWDGRTRKVHHVVVVPDLASARRLNRRLGKIGNLAADGRPTLGLDARDLLEMVLECGPGSFLFPAHVWTPWFSVLGARSGFDSIEECYRDLAGQVFAAETGLSSDPAMNWQVSRLDRFSLISNSDAHSPRRIGREATWFDTGFCLESVRRALETGGGLAGTIEFFPEEGKYHADGHVRCRFRCDPDRARQLGSICPRCGHPLTMGVAHRVALLADRPPGVRPSRARPFWSLMPLDELVAELEGVGPGSKRVREMVLDWVTRVAPEIPLLSEVPAEVLARECSPRLARAVRRLREGRVLREPGYDGVYGRIRVGRCSR